jgi:hypothetical protein
MPVNKARESELKQPAKPAANGSGAAEVEPRPEMSRIASAFPPIAEYAFLSDCEVNCLIAPSGRVEWMCLPRPDSPSVFASILDRAAGNFRFGPTNVQVPAGRRYLPGTLVLETTWRTRTGWMIVRDALCIGPWYHSQRRSGTNRRPPTDHEAEHILLRTAKCVVGSVELSLDCHPVFDYGRTSAKWEYAGPGYGEAIAGGGEDEVPLRLVTDLNIGFEGPGAHATKTLRQGERAYVAMVWPLDRQGVLGRASRAFHLRRGVPARRANRGLLARVDQQRGISRTPVAELSPAQRPHAERPHVQPQRRAAGRADHLAAGDDRRRAQLGLSVHLDSRRHLHAMGALHAGLRARGKRLLLFHRRRRGEHAGPAGHVRHQW